jgi:hypothetical protein
LRHSYRNPRSRDRNLRESHRVTIDQFPTSSLFVLFSFLQSSLIPKDRIDPHGSKGSLSMEHGVSRSEELPDKGLGLLLSMAVQSSGCTRREVGLRSSIHKDALRRILAGNRSPTLGEASGILAACGGSAQALLILSILGENERAAVWSDQPIAHFLESFFAELPAALDRTLGNQLQEVRPRWAKGTAQRVARLLSDHIDELERKDALAAEFRDHPHA